MRLSSAEGRGVVFGWQFAFEKRMVLCCCILIIKLALICLMYGISS